MPRKPSAYNATKRISSNVRHTIGANVRNRRLTLGWSQQELADRFGVSRATVSQYEIGTGEINVGDLPRLAGILGIELVEFFNAPPPVSAPHLSPTSKDTSQAGFIPGAIQRIDKNEEEFAEEAAATDPLPAYDASHPAPKKNIFTIDNGDGTRYRVKSDNRIYLIDYRQSTAREIGIFASDAKVPVVTALLGSILSLSAEDQETVRRVVAAMPVNLPPDPDEEDTNRGDNEPSERLAGHFEGSMDRQTAPSEQT